MASSVTVRLYLLVILIVCTVLFSCISGEDDYEPEVGAIGRHPSYEEGGEDHGSEGNGEDHGHEGGAEQGGHGGGEDHGHEGGEGHDDGEGGEEHGHEGGEGHDDGEGGEEHGHEGGEGHEEGHGAGGGGGVGDPAHIVDGGLLCFHEKHIYRSCDESCRLSASGDLHVLSDQVDEFCNGPCLEETNLVLDCLEGIMEHFLFFNQATTQDVRDTIHAGCGHGEHRGDFDVGEHIEAEGSGGIGIEPKFSLLLVLMTTFVFQIIVI